MNANLLRRVNWLWKHRHTHTGDTLQEQITVIRERLDIVEPPAFSDQTTAYTHLVLGSAQTIPVGGDPIVWTAQHAAILPLAFDLSVPISALTISKAGPYVLVIEGGWESYQDGGSVWITREQSGVEAKVWPPAEDQNWTATDGQDGFWVGPAIPCEVGDILRVYIDHDDASAHDLAWATLGLYLVEPLSAGAAGEVVATCPTLGSEINVSTDNHSAFPGYVVAGDGTHLVAYREGSGHVSTNGVIKLRKSTDNGATWSSATTIFSNVSYDLRGASLTKLASGRVVCVTGARSSAGSNITDGGFTFYSDDNGVTWSIPVQINDDFNDFSRAECGLTELSDGTWLLPVYGEDTTDTFRSAKVLSSTDAGSTWTVLATIANGDVDGHSYGEPGIVRVGSRLVALLRVETPSHSLGGFMYRSASDDNGATWSTPQLVLESVGGAPKPVLRINGDIVCLIRDTSGAPSTYPTVYFRSGNLGAAWEKCQTFPADNSKGVYGQIAEDLDGKLGVVYADEVSATGTAASDVWFRREV
jgi:hypothetical protein